MNEPTIRYLRNVLRSLSGTDDYARRPRRHMARPIPRARTIRDLELARQRRERRRIPERTHREWSTTMTGVLAIPRPMLPIGPIGWRLASGMIAMSCTASLIFGIADAAYYVDSINLAGAVLVPGEEIYAAAAVEGANVFWLDPAEVGDKIRVVPGIKQATVRVELPVSVKVHVLEQEPVIVWEHGDERSWVDAEGGVFPVRLDDVPSLLSIVVDDYTVTSAPVQQVAPEVVASALQLKALRPNIEQLHYDSAQGVSYQDGRNWRGVFGTGGNMSMKLKVYEALIENLLSRGLHPTLINVADLETPYYLE